MYDFTANHESVHLPEPLPTKAALDELAAQIEADVRKKVAAEEIDKHKKRIAEIQAELVEGITAERGEVSETDMLQAEADATTQAIAEAEGTAAPGGGGVRIA